LNKQLSQRVFKIIIWSILIIAFLAVNIAVYHDTYVVENKGYISHNVIDSNQVFKAITNDMVIEQSFVVKENDFSGFGIKFSTFNNRTDSVVYVSLRRASDMTEVKSWVLSTLLVQHNEYYNFFLDPIENSKSTEYVISIRYANVEKNNHIAPMFATENFIEGVFKVNGVVQEGRIATKYYTTKNNANSLFLGGCFTYLTAVIVTVLFMLFRRKDLSRIFVPVAVIFGLLYMITTPAFRAQDEDLHFYRAYEISEGHLTSDLLNGVGGRVLPSSLENITRPGVTKIKYEDTFKAFELQLKPNFSEFVEFPNAALYSPVVYIPQASGIFLAKALRLNPMWMVYFGRLFNLVLWIFIMKMAISLMPLGKVAMFVVALSPMSLFTVSSLSADGVTNAVIMLFIALVLHLAYGSCAKVKKRHLATLLFLGTVMALCKFVYLPICALCLIIPKEKYPKHIRKVFANSLLLVIPLVVNIIWLGIASVYRIDQINSGVSTPLQINNVLFNPATFFLVMAQTTVYFFNFYIQSLFGASLGWFDIPVYTWISMIYMLIISFLAVTDNSILIKKRDKLVMLVVSLVIIALVYVSLYVSWTRVGESIVGGVQGRYFLPVIPIILLLFNNSKIKVFFDRINLNVAFGVLVSLLQFPVLITLLLYHI